ITGSGHNIWNKDDAFQFAARKVSGDLVFRMDVEWVGEGKAKHRKACAMVRQSLDADAAYADVAVHGDGLIALQYRKTKGGLTFSVPTPIQARPPSSWSATATSSRFRRPPRASRFSRS